MATRVNPDCKLEDQGIEGLGRVYYNLLEPALVEAAIRRGEGHLGLGGAFLVETGAKTGRSPKDKFVVRTPSVEDSQVCAPSAALVGLLSSCLIAGSRV